MNAFIYRVSYWLGMMHWDSGVVPPEVIQAFQAGNIPAGPALDLGCGTGTNVIYMAQQGRQAIGIDFVPEAIARAQQKAKEAGVVDRTQFVRADVTRLKELGLPRCAFTLDMGCFHGLSPEGQRRYVQGLADLMIPRGRFMLYVIEPNREAGVTYGMTPDAVRAIFAPWFAIDRQETGSFRNRKSAWFWMTRKAESDPAAR
jgi:cyclopropane fatty-acyl-phospholipid synthase-like methyltransferase